MNAPSPAPRKPAPARSRRPSPRKPILFFSLLIILALLLLTRLPGHLPGSSGGKGITPPDCPDWITQDFLPENPWSRPGDPLTQVNGIVVHYVGNPGTTAAQNHSYFASLARTHATYASSHFLVGLDGEILQNIPLDEIAYCSNNRNDDTIAIECCHPDEEGKFNDATLASLRKLVSWLMDSYHLTADQVIRHYDVTGKECPRYYVRHPEAWDAFRASLGEESVG